MRKKTWKEWKTSEISFLQQLLWDGKSPNECAALLGRTVRAIYACCQYRQIRIRSTCDLAPQLWTGAEEKELRKLIAEGYSIRECAWRLKRTHDSIRAKCRSLNLRIPPHWGFRHESHAVQPQSGMPS